MYHFVCLSELCALCEMAQCCHYYLLVVPCARLTRPPALPPFCDRFASLYCAVLRCAVLCRAVCLALQAGGVQMARGRRPSESHRR